MRTFKPNLPWCLPRARVADFAVETIIKPNLRFEPEDEDRAAHLTIKVLCDLHEELMKLEREIAECIFNELASPPVPVNGSDVSDARGSARGGEASTPNRASFSKGDA